MDNVQAAAAAASLIQKGYVETDSGQMHYRRAKAEEASAGSLLLLHQRPSSSRMWEPVLPLLAQHGFDAVALDLPGHGESFHPQNEDFTLPAFAKSVSSAISQLGFADEVVSIVGHHLGAAVAMQVAVDFPDKVKKLALWGVPILEKGIKEGQVPGAPDFEDDELKDVVKFWKIRKMYTTRPGYVMPPKTRVARLIELLQSNHKAAELILTMDVKSLVKHIRQPTLCMCGDNEMLKDVTVVTAEELENGSLCYIPNAGLDVQDEYTHEFTTALVEFLG